MERDYGPDILGLFPDEDLAAYLAVLMRMARCGEVSVQERNLAVPLASLLGGREETTREALNLADDEATVEQLVQRLKVPALRLFLYRDSCRMALADGHVDPEEEALLEQIRVLLQVEPEMATRIMDSVKAIAKKQEELLTLLVED